MDRSKCLSGCRLWVLGLVPSLNYKARYRIQDRSVTMRASGRADGFAAEAMRHLSGAVNSVERGIGRFLARGVLPGGLAKLFAGGGFVEQVVGDLKGQSGLLSVLGYRVQFVIARAADDRADAYGAANQGAGLGAVNLFELSGGYRFALELNIQYLAADQSPRRRRGVSQFRNHARFRFRGQRLVIGERQKRLG